MRSRSSGGTSSSASATNSSKRSELISTAMLRESSTGRTLSTSPVPSDELGVERDLDGRQGLGDRAAGLGRRGVLLELGGVDAGHVGPGHEVDLGDPEAALD